MKIFFFICSIVSIIALIMITVFIFANGVPGIANIGLGQFLFGTTWQPSADIFGILPMLLGSLYVTLGSILIGFPLGLFIAIFLSELAPPTLVRLIQPAVNIMAGIPSVVFGFFGLMVLVPKIMDISGPGNSMLAAIFILAIMMLPTVVSICYTGLRSVPKDYREGSYALGETQVSTIFRVTVPAAKSSIFTALGLAAGRAIGEATAVVLVSGNTVQIPGSIFDSVRTLTANCTIEMGYASGIHLEALYGTAVVLFFFIILINLGIAFLNRKKVM